MCAFMIRSDLEERKIPKEIPVRFCSVHAETLFDRTDNEHSRCETKLHLSGNFCLKKSVDVQGDIK